MESLCGIFYAFHTFMDEQIYKGRAHTDLGEKGIFKNDMYYFEPNTSFRKGRLTPLLLPVFESKEWPFLAIQISKGYRIQLY